MGVKHVRVWPLLIKRAGRCSLPGGGEEGSSALGLLEGGDPVLDSSPRCGVVPLLVVGSVASKPPQTSLLFRPCRALPVMYAVALDLRVFANNVSLISITFVLKPKLGVSLLLNFM